MTLVAPGLSLGRLGCTLADLAVSCPRCWLPVAPGVNSYDRFFYLCPCGRSWSALLGDIVRLRGR